MNSQERVLASFRHKTPDRVPLDYCAVPEIDVPVENILALYDDIGAT